MVDEPKSNEQGLVYEYQNDGEYVSDEDEWERNPNRHRERRDFRSEGVPPRDDKPGTNERGAHISYIVVVRVRIQGTGSGASGGGRRGRRWDERTCCENGRGVPTLYTCAPSSIGVDGYTIELFQKRARR